MAITLDFNAILSNPFIKFIACILLLIMLVDVYVFYMKVIIKMVKYGLRNFDEGCVGIVILFIVVIMTALFVACAANLLHELPIKLICA